MRYNYQPMKYLTVLLLIVFGNAQSSLSTFKNSLLMDHNTNLPYTGVLESYNQDWNNNQVEFAQSYVGGIKQGDEKGYYKSGKLKSIGKFIKGKIEGVVELYYENGTLQARVDMNNGAKEGRAVSYHSNGYKESERFYFKGKVQGLARTWHENGRLKTKVYYSNGMMNGEFVSYYESGVVSEEIKYDHGAPKFKRLYREDGTLADEAGFFDKELIEKILG
ncbi:MAG TPA: toxin-antitoxin system YwqK family antitoxin [Candidatus Thioglobus sp.]|nr:toxin-antitoxin system YwqK family antitoxin [Candidatus Thioglobus sp.]